MRVVALYPPDRRRLAIQEMAPLAVDKNCRRCPIHTMASSVCMSALGDAGGLLVVGGQPTSTDIAEDTIFSGTPGHAVRSLVEQFWPGPVAYDYAIRCGVPNSQSRKALDAVTRHGHKCAPYLAQTLREVNPTRVVLIGPQAAAAFTGDKLDTYSIRRGYGWLQHDGEDVPVFILHDHVKMRKNVFHAKWFDKDLEWALTTQVSDLEKSPFYTEAYFIETEDDADEAIEVIEATGGCTFDVETFEHMYDKWFEILCLAACPYGSDVPYLWGRDALRNDRIRERLVAMLGNPAFGKSGQNVKFDASAVQQAWGVRVQNLDHDTRLVRKMMWSDSAADLDNLTCLVGMCGHKGEARQHLEQAVTAISRARRRAKQSKATRLLPGVEHPVIEHVVERAHVPPLALAYKLVDRDVLERYCALDALSTERLRRRQVRAFAPVKDSIQRVWNEVVRPANEAYTQIQAWGFAINRDALMSYDQFLRGEVAPVAERLKRYNFNPASNADTAVFLYDHLKLKKPVVMDMEVRSVDHEALSRLVGKHPAVRDILTFRTLEKLRSTYTHGMLPHIADDGRIHPTINLDGAQTGRSSCTRPNLQNIPRADKDKTHALLARSLFTVPPGYTLVQLDFCLAKGTLVDTPTGHRSIETLRPDDLVFTYNHTTKHPDCSRVVRTKYTGMRRTLRVVLDNGEQVRCTAEHRWLLVDGSEVTAAQLRPGTRLLSMRRSYADPNHHVVAVVDDGLVVPTYDIEVERDHNFALTAGVFVHNSQLELRVAAMLSKDTKMTALFKSGKDFHLGTAELISKPRWGIEPHEVQKHHRSEAKAFSFGLLYGKSDAGLASDLGITVREAENLREQILGEFKDLARWVDEQLHYSMRTGWTWTHWNGERARRRPLHVLGSRDPADRKAIGTAKRSTRNCFDYDTEVLTREGWKSGYEVGDSEVLLTKNADTGELEWQPAGFKHFPDYDGPVHVWRSRAFSAVTTPEHRWLVDMKSRLTRCVLTNQFRGHGDERIHRTGKYAMPDSTQFTDDELRLVGWAATDAHHVKLHKTDRVTKILVGQSKPGTVVELTALFSRFGVTPICAKRYRGNYPTYTWRIPDTLFDKVYAVVAGRRFTWEFIWSLSPRQARILLNTVQRADGVKICASDHDKASRYQALATIAGYHATITVRDTTGLPRHSKHVQSAGVVATRPHYLVHVAQRPCAQVTRNQMRVEKGSGVWCPYVPNTYVVVRREGKVYITGQTPIQGSANEYCAASTAAIVRWILDERVDARVVLTVHDSIMLEVRDHLVDEVAHKCRHIMESWYTDGVPFVADIEVGDSWGTLKKYELPR